MDGKIENDLTMLEIITYGHPVLHRKAEPILNITEKIIQTAQRMAYTMHAAPGVGLAAPQINQGIRLITVDLSVGEKPRELYILVNPEILEREGVAVMEEGCLSLPGINENVTRPSRVRVRGIDLLTGSEKTIEAEGFLARVFCHEVDHLDGTLFIDHLSPLKRGLARKKLKELNEDGSAE
jgi:peptide deformylase